MHVSCVCLHILLTRIVCIRVDIYKHYLWYTGVSYYLSVMAHKWECNQVGYVSCYTPSLKSEGRIHDVYEPQ